MSKVEPPSAPWGYESCAAYFERGSRVVSGASEGMVLNLDRGIHGGILVNVLWDATGIAALTHPSQLRRVEYSLGKLSL